MKQGTNTVKKSSPITELSAIDWELCIRLANHKPAVAQEILDYIVQHLPADLKIIQHALTKPDLEEALRCVHKLHGALCYSGLPRLKTAIAQLESCLKQTPPDPARVKALSRIMEKEAEAVLASPLPY